jgi:hypothetical protein
VSRAMWLSTMICFFNLVAVGARLHVGPCLFFAESQATWLSAKLCFFERSWLGLHVGPPGAALRRES